MLKQWRDVPFNKPVFKARVSIEGLAVIGRHARHYVADRSVASGEEEIVILTVKGRAAARRVRLSEPLLTPGRTITAMRSNFPRIARLISAPEESAGTGYKSAMAHPDGPAQDETVATEPHAVAAEKGVPVHNRPVSNGGSVRLGA